MNDELKLWIADFKIINLSPFISPCFACAYNIGTNRAAAKTNILDELKNNVRLGSDEKIEIGKIIEVEIPGYKIIIEPL